MRYNGGKTASCLGVLASLLLLAGCKDSMGLQRQYVHDRDHCREMAEMKLGTYVPVDTSPVGEKEKNAMLLSLFSECMRGVDWNVAGAKKDKDKDKDAKAAASKPAAAAAAPAAAPAAVAAPSPGAPGYYVLMPAVGVPVMPAYAAPAYPPVPPANAVSPAPQGASAETAASAAEAKPAAATGNRSVYDSGSQGKPAAAGAAISPTNVNVHNTIQSPAAVQPPSATASATRAVTAEAAQNAAGQVGQAAQNAAMLPGVNAQDAAAQAGQAAQARAMQPAPSTTRLANAPRTRPAQNAARSKRKLSSGTKPDFVETYPGESSGAGQFAPSGTRAFAPANLPPKPVTQPSLESIIEKE